MKSLWNEKFDLIIPCHEKDRDVLKESIKYMEDNVIGYRKIFIVSKENYFPNRNDLEFVPESKYPFSKKDIAKYAPKGRAGWYYTQFLRMYFFQVMGKKVLDNLVTIDADTFLIKKTKFFEKGIPIHNVDIGHHQPYYDISLKILGFGKEHPKYSGTAHYLPYQRDYIKEIFDMNYKRNKEDFWLTVMKNIDYSTESSFSWYDLYFNYMLKFHPKKIKIKKLEYIDFPSYDPVYLRLFNLLGYNYLSAHHYLQVGSFVKIKTVLRSFLTRIGIKRHLKVALIKLGVFKVK